LSAAKSRLAGQQTTNNEQQTTNNKQRTTNNEPRTTNNKHRTQNTEHQTLNTKQFTSPQAGSLFQANKARFSNATLKKAQSKRDSARSAERQANKQGTQIYSVIANNPGTKNVKLQNKYYFCWAIKISNRLNGSLQI
jgi:hypothetical protein